MNYQALEKEKEKSTRNSSSYLSNYRKFLHLILVRQCPELLNNTIILCLPFAVRYVDNSLSLGSVFFISTSPAVPRPMPTYKMHIILESF